MRTQHATTRGVAFDTGFNACQKSTAIGATSPDDIMGPEGCQALRSLEQPNWLGVTFPGRKMKLQRRGQTEPGPVTLC